jgi:hypothetical protein
MVNAKSPFMTAPELSEMTGTSLSKAYGLIRLMNEELRQRGYLTVRGKVNRSYALERFGLEAVRDGGDL